jgi:hypothetical protein
MIFLTSSFQKNSDMVKQILKQWRLAFLMCGILLAGLSAHSQVSVQFNHPAYLLTKDQLWNLVLVNTGTAVPVARVEITLNDVASSQVLCRLTSKNMSLPAGPKVITLQEALPVQTVVYSQGFTDLNPYGILPPGRFYMCADVIRIENDTYISMGDACEDIEVVSFSPVQLSAPENASVSETKHPFFTWLPPMPLTQFNQLAYDIKLVELMQNQQAVDGIDNNLPLLNITGLPAATYNYLSSAPTLQPGKVYAWQVTAKNNNQPVSVSEVWTFTVADSTKQPVSPRQAVYSPLRKEAGSNFITITGDLNFEYNNELNDPEAVVKIIDINAGNAASIVKENLVLPSVYGPNFISIDARETLHLSTGKFYRLVLTNSKKEEWTVSFTIK